jgi:hypothetical protein
MTLAWLLTTLSPLQIGFSTDHEDKIRFSGMPLHPYRPAFRRRGFVLIQGCVDTIGPQTIRQIQDAVHVFVRVVAVADEDPQYGWGGSGVHGEIVPLF